MNLIGILHDEIDEWWPLIVDLVRKPLERTGAIRDFHPEDIRELIRRRDMQCWVAHNGHVITACCVTQIIVYPQRKVLGLVLVGAKRNTIKQWLQNLDVMKAFAAEAGCSALRGWGRKGWETVLRPDVVRVEFDIEV